MLLRNTANISIQAINKFLKRNYFRSKTYSSKVGNYVLYPVKSRFYKIEEITKKFLSLF